MATNYTEYRALKDSFFKKHKHDFQCDTSSMDEYGTYYKTYVFADGGIWYERNAHVCRKATAKAVVEGIEIELSQDVELFEVEYFSSDDANSRKYYEKW